MIRYLLDPENPTESCKSRGSSLRIHFKNTWKTAQAIKGMQIGKATRYLKGPESAECLLCLLKNAESNANHQGLM